MAGADIDLDAAQAQREHLADQLQHALHARIPIPVGIASGRAGHHHKLHALLRSIAVECGDWGTVQSLRDNIVSFTIDRGTEALFAASPRSALNDERFRPRI
eukprot:9053391-Alexandrium_andersonii.AAC.1